LINSMRLVEMRLEKEKKGLYIYFYFQKLFRNYEQLY